MASHDGLTFALAIVATVRVPGSGAPARGDRGAFLTYLGVAAGLVALVAHTAGSIPRP